VTAPPALWERNATFRARLRGGEPSFGIFLAMGSPVSAEVCGGAGWDWCLIDLEHGLGAEASMHAELVALELMGTPALVRIESGAPLRIGRVLDHGAAGIMVPRLGSAADVAQVVACTRYAPTGARGVAFSARGAGYGAASADDTSLINESITVFIQIENAGAVAEIDAIAAIDGVDVLFVGPNDLTHTLGIPGRFEDPHYLDTLALIANAAKSAGKVAAIMLHSTDEVEWLRPMGYSCFGVTNDASLLAQASRAALASISCRM